MQDLEQLPVVILLVVGFKLSSEPLLGSRGDANAKMVLILLIFLTTFCL